MASKSLTASMTVSAANLWFWVGCPTIIYAPRVVVGSWKLDGLFQKVFESTQTTSSILLLLDFSVSGLWIIVNYHRNPNNNDRDLVEQSTEDIVCIWVQAGGIFGNVVARILFIGKSWEDHPVRWISSRSPWERACSPANPLRKGTESIGPGLATADRS